MEKKWECDDCGRQLESELEPQNCPCGSEEIRAQEQLSMLEQMMKDFLKDNSPGRS
ncbi:MAG: hypothetical protein H8Z69_01260 [Nanohaloarchaea archaeon]|nr:hypothetical protein [Candidatus Nanohaloarchaea archaeon]